MQDKYKYMYVVFKTISYVWFQFFITLDLFVKTSSVIESVFYKVPKPKRITERLAHKQ